MSGILKLESLTKGNTLKQGDKTPLKYRLFDADGDKLSIAGKSAEVRLVYPDFLTIGYKKDGLTVSQDDTVTFTIDRVIPSRIYHVEIIVDEQFIFPSRADESKFTVDKSSFGTETNIIEIVGVDAVVRKAVDLINEDPSLIIDEDKLVADIISNTGIGSIEEYRQQFNDVIKELSEEKDYHSLPEIAGARGGFGTLGDRLNHTISKGEVNINHFDEATRQTFLEAQGIDVNYVLGDKNVLPKNTTFFQISKNMFNKDAAIPNTTILSDSGKLYNSDRFYASEYISVEPNTTYTRSHGWTLAIYNDDKTFIEGFSSSQSGSLTFTTPENARYVRMSIHENHIDVTQIEKGAEQTDYEEYETFIPEKYLEKRKTTPEYTTPEYMSFFGVGKNLFDVSAITMGFSISSADGSIFSRLDYKISDWIEVGENVTLTKSRAHTAGFYDSNKKPIGGVTKETPTFTTPPGTRYVRISFAPKDSPENAQLEFGETVTNFEPYGIKLKDEYIGNVSTEVRFKAEFSTTLTPDNIENSHTGNLSLISKKTIQHGDTPPDVIGYLYLDEETQKVYYSAGNADNPEFLFDWQPSLSEGQPCEVHNAFITQEGDIIFMRNRLRRNPVIYPAGDYGNPVVVDFGSNLKPYAFETDAGIDIHPSGDYFIFGEYTNHKQSDEDNNDPRNVWKVTKPFSDPNNWTVKHSFKHVFYSSPESNDPGNEIGHIHTAIRDFYTNNWYVSTGDIDRHCRVWESEDDGETWHEVARDKEAIDTSGVWQSVADNGQAWRAFGMIYTEDAAYWGTDAHGVNLHKLYKVRRASTGKLDFSTLEPLANLDLTSGQPQPTYTTCYVREPNGLLFLDRAEPRTDHKLDLLFWSFEYEELFNLGTYDRIPNEDSTNRSGWGNQVASFYQPTNEDGIVLGASSRIRRNKMDVLNNRIDNRVGNIKINIYEV